MIPLVIKGYLKAAGRKLEYQFYGSPRSSAPTLVFLHEGLGCVAAWGKFPSLLVETTGLSALVYSRAGYGRSEPVSLTRLPRFMHDEGMVVLPEVLQEANIKQSILLGHSDGASIALMYAATAKPASVRAVIVEAPHVFVEDLTLRSIAALADEYGEGNLKIALERYHGTHVDQTFWGWNRAWLNPAFRTWNIEEYLPQITIPVLVIQGEQDEYGTIKQVEAIERGVAGPVRTVVLPNCGHAPHRSARDAVMKEVTSFIRDLL